MLCPEAQRLLISTDIKEDALEVLARMKPSRQIEAAQLMIAANCYSRRFAWTLIAASPRGLVKNRKAYPKVAMSAHKLKLASREMTILADQLTSLPDRRFDFITLMQICRFTESLLSNARIVRYIEKKYSGMVRELRAVINEHQDARLEPAKFSPPIVCRGKGNARTPEPRSELGRKAGMARWKDGTRNCHS
jgi:hypothetical protein